MHCASSCCAGGSASPAATAGWARARPCAGSAVRRGVTMREGICGGGERTARTASLATRRSSTSTLLSLGSQNSRGRRRMASCCPQTCARATAWERSWGCQAALADRGPARLVTVSSNRPLNCLTVEVLIRRRIIVFDRLYAHKLLPPIGIAHGSPKLGGSQPRVEDVPRDWRADLERVGPRLAGPYGPEGAKHLGRERAGRR
jgi:hypothetical protein